MLVSRDGSEIKSMFELGLSYLKNGKIEHALNSFMKVLLHWPDCAEAYNNIGFIYFNKQNYEQAVQCFLRALKAHPSNGRFMHNIGMCYGKMSDWESAIKFYRMSIEEDGNYAHSYYNLAGIYRDLGQYEKALPLYEQVIVFNGELSIDAEFMVSSIKGNNINSAPREYLTRLFDQYALYYDEHMHSQLSYNSAFVFEKLIKSIGRSYGTVLDIGCGTGAVGKYLMSASEYMIGIDLSECMIDVCKGKGYYSECLVGDFIDMPDFGNKGRFDCVTLCDVLIYYGEIHAMVKKSCDLLASKGDFIVNFEHGNIDNYQLDLNGRYRHGRDFVLGTLEEEGLVIKDIIESYSRVEQGKKIDSTFVRARKL